MSLPALELFCCVLAALCGFTWLECLLCCGFAPLLPLLISHPVDSSATAVLEGVDAVSILESVIQ